MISLYESEMIHQDDSIIMIINNSDNNDNNDNQDDRI